MLMLHFYLILSQTNVSKDVENIASSCTFFGMKSNINQNLCI